MAALNYHHLRCFHAVATAGGLTAASRAMHVSPSALSVALAALEARLGHRLFDRAHRRMTLTEAGRIALAHAETIFQQGEEMLGTLAGRGPARGVLRVGAEATLSRNFQLGLLRPLLARADAMLVLRSGTLADLLAQLTAHTLDLVLATGAAGRDAGPARSQLVAEFPVAIVGPPPRKRAGRFIFPRDLSGQPILLPGRANPIRAGFDQLLQQAGVVPVVAAEVDDMALLRLLAREGHALALVPSVVVQDELRAGLLRRRALVPGLTERFYAITAERRFGSPLLQHLLP